MEVRMYRVWQLVIEHMQVPMFETHHRIYLHKYLNVFDHQQPHPVEEDLGGVAAAGRQHYQIKINSWKEIIPPGFSFFFFSFLMQPTENVTFGSSTIRELYL